MVSSRLRRKIWPVGDELAAVVHDETETQRDPVHDKILFFFPLWPVLSVQTVRGENTADTRQEPTKQVMILSLLWIVTDNKSGR